MNGGILGKNAPGRMRGYRIECKKISTIRFRLLKGLKQIETFHPAEYTIYFVYCMLLQYFSPANVRLKNAFQNLLAAL